MQAKTTVKMLYKSTSIYAAFYRMLFSEQFQFSTFIQESMFNYKIIKPLFLPTILTKYDQWREYFHKIETLQLFYIILKLKRLENSTAKR